MRRPYFTTGDFNLKLTNPATQLDKMDCVKGNLAIVGISHVLEP
jgi:hypothetical protein